jgi:hypothetical protein
MLSCNLADVCRTSVLPNHNTSIEYSCWCPSSASRCGKCCRRHSIRDLYQTVVNINISVRDVPTLTYIAALAVTNLSPYSQLLLQRPVTFYWFSVGMATRTGSSLYTSSLEVLEPALRSQHSSSASKLRSTLRIWLWQHLHCILVIVLGSLLAWLASLLYYRAA